MSNWGIKQRVLFLSIFPTIVITIFMGIYFVGVRVKELNEGIISKGNNIVSQLSGIGQNGVFTGDLDALMRISRKEISEEVSSIVFYNRNGSEIASAGKLTSTISQQDLQENLKVTIKKYPNSMAFIAPISHPNVIIENNKTNSSIIGWVKIELELSVIRAEIYQTLIHVGTIALLGIIISWLIAFRMGNSVIRPILSITRAVGKIKQGELNTRVKTTAKWELGELKSGINTMARSLENAHKGMTDKIHQTTLDLRKSLQTIEFQNVELQVSRNDAKNLSDAKSEFLATMSHELRTPLNGMMGFINLLKKTELTKEQLEFIDIIQKSSENLLKLINEVLDFSKIEAGKLKITKEPMDLIECIEESITLLAPIAHDKNLELVPFIYSDTPQKIIGDSLRIKQVITNILSNALKFTDSGSIIVRTMVVESATNSDTTICISITDTGMGLDEEQKKVIFTAFNQASPNIARRFGGTGLGLVICKRLIEQMQGEIDVESSPQQGSTFWFTFKAKVIERPAINSNESFIARKKALVLEKHDVARLALLHTLKLWDLDTIEAKEVDECLNLEKFADLSLLILSIGSNNVSGNSYLELINYANSNNVKIVVIISSSQNEIKNLFKKLGVEIFITKPIRRNSLYNGLCEIFASNVVAEKEVKPIILTSKLNILAVDDNESNLKLLDGLLYSKMNIIPAYSGEAAIKIANTKKYDLILMDINMPGMDGIATTKIIRKSSLFNKKTPIVALSAYIASEASKKLKNANIKWYLTKPIVEANLIATIEAAINNKEISNENEDKLSLDITENYKKLKSIDIQLSTKLAAGNKKLAFDLFSMLVKSLPKVKTKIDELFQTKDFDALLDEVHKLHGACCYTGVPKLKAILKTIEKNLVDKNHSDIKELVAAFKLEVDVILTKVDTTLEKFKRIVVTSGETV